MLEENPVADPWAIRCAPSLLSVRGSKIPEMHRYRSLCRPNFRWAQAPRRLPSRYSTLRWLNTWLPRPTRTYNRNSRCEIMASVGVHVAMSDATFNFVARAYTFSKSYSRNALGPCRHSRFSLDLVGDGVADLVQYSVYTSCSGQSATNVKNDVISVT